MHQYLFSAEFFYKIDVDENYTFFENSQIIGYVHEREINEEYIEGIINQCDKNFKPFIIEMNNQILSAIKNLKF